MVLYRSEVLEAHKKPMQDHSDDFLERLIFSAEFHELWNLYYDFLSEENARERKADAYARANDERYPIISAN